MTTINAGPIVLPVLAICLGLLALPAVRRRVSIARRRPRTFAVLIAYAAAVIAITIFPITMRPPEYWLGEPWWTVIHWIPFDVDGASMVLNVIMTIPIGVLLPLLWPRTGTVRGVAVPALWVSVVIELTQLVIAVTVYSRRTVDINDLLANAAGAVLGLLMLRLAQAASGPDETTAAETPPVEPRAAESATQG